MLGNLKFFSENVCFDAEEREVDFEDTSLTENTRCAYPLKHVSNALIPAMVERHPSAIVLLCCDAFGVLPPVSVLTPEQGRGEPSFLTG
jgi:phosphoenolpyruvate carboxykinase (ATP)